MAPVTASPHGRGRGEYCEPRVRAGRTSLRRQTMTYFQPPLISFLQVTQAHADQQPDVIVIQGIEDLLTRAARLHDAQHPQQAEMLGHRRWVDAQERGQSRRRHVLVDQGIQNAHPRGVRHGAKEVRQRVRQLFREQRVGIGAVRPFRLTLRRGSVSFNPDPRASQGFLFRPGDGDLLFPAHDAIPVSSYPVRNATPGASVPRGQWG